MFYLSLLRFSKKEKKDELVAINESEESSWSFTPTKTKACLSQHEWNYCFPSTYTMFFFDVKTPRWKKLKVLEENVLFVCWRFFQFGRRCFLAENVINALNVTSKVGWRHHQTRLSVSTTWCRVHKERWASGKNGISSGKNTGLRRKWRKQTGQTSYSERISSFEML